MIQEIDYAGQAAAAIQQYFAHKDPKAPLDMRLFALSFQFGRRSNTEVPMFRGDVETYLISGKLEGRNDSYANLWFTPGTHVGRTKEEAFKAIISKLQIKGIDFGTHEFLEFIDDAPDDLRGELHRLVYPRYFEDGNFEGPTGKWVPLSQLDQYEMSPAHRRIVENSVRYLELDT